MKKLSTLVFAAVLSVAGTGCGNDSLLAGMGGALGANGNGEGDGGDGEGECGGDAAEQEAAIADLGANICADCNAADGTAEHLFAKINPHEYEGGALEVGLVIGSPDGLAGLTTKFQINEIELAIPADAWKTSDDGTVGRVVLFREAGLPQGEYHVWFAVEGAATEEPPAEEPAAFNEEETPPPTEGEEEPGATDSAVWKVDCEQPEEPGEEHPGDEPTDEPTDEPHDPPTEDDPPAEAPPAEEPPAE